MLPHWKENDLIVNGNKIHYTRTGDGSKPPIVLAHGFSDNGKCWLPVALELEANYDLIKKAFSETSFLKDLPATRLTSLSKYPDSLHCR